MALITRANLKVMLGVAAVDTTQDAVLDLLLDIVTARIQTFCGNRVFASASYTEIYSGNGTPWLCLNQRPVTTLTSIYQDDGAYYGSVTGAFASTTLLVSGTDYALDMDLTTATSKTGRVLRIGGVWTKLEGVERGVISRVPQSWGTGNIKVTYTAGYATIPFDLQGAAYLLCSQTFASWPKGGGLLTEEHWEDYGYKLTLAVNKTWAGLSSEMLGMLAPYMNRAIG